MKFPASLKHFLKPSLGKVGLTGLAFCLALGAFAPPAPTNLTVVDESQAKRSQLIAQVKQIPSPRH